jgi:predicted transcriptional regulator
MSYIHMNETRSVKRNIIEMIPCDSSFAEAIDAGIADADAGRLTSLATVKAKWLSR